MSYPISRRTFLSGFSMTVLGCATDRSAQREPTAQAGPVAQPTSVKGPPRSLESARPTPNSAKAVDIGDDFTQLEKQVGGRIGVYVINTGTNEALQHREKERFALCSTFKWALAAAILTEVDRGQCSLSQPLLFAQKDLLEYAPVTRARIDEGRITVAEALEAAVSVSDNTAANLLLAHLGGPAQFTRFLRENGDTVTRLDRNEPMLNTNEPGDPRDTTSPQSMVGLLGTLLTGTVLSPTSRDLLLRFMLESKTGSNRLRKGLPSSYRVADKTGSGRNGAVNDVAIAWPRNAPPLLMAVYLSESLRPTPELERVHSDIGRIVAKRLVPKLI